MVKGRSEEGAIQKSGGGEGGKFVIGGSKAPLPRPIPLQGIQRAWHNGLGKGARRGTKLLDCMLKLREKVISEMDRRRISFIYYYYYYFYSFERLFKHQCMQVRKKNN